LNIKSARTDKNRKYGVISVVDRMIVKDLLKTVIAVLSVLVVIIVSRQFIRVLAEAIEGNISNETVLSILGLRVVIAISAFLPVATFMAILMVLGRMYRDQEMAAVASAGGGAGTIYHAVFLLIFPLSVVGGGLSMKAAPWAEAQVQLLMNEDQSSADIRGISAGRFSEYSDGDLVFYTEHVESNGQMQHVFVQNREHGKLGVVSARHGHMEYRPGGLYLILENGERIQGLPGNKNFVIENFSEYGVLIKQKNRVITLKRDAVPTLKLWQSPQLFDKAEIQKRLSVPLAIIFLSFLAIPLAKLSPRSGIYASLLIAFGVYFIYANLKRVSYSWVVNGIIPVWVGYCWIYWLLVGLGTLLLIRLYGWEWIKMQLKGMIKP